ncbi:hypothetical protein T09_5115 [Trichinella sp. T9]|nr:hypothetical protein T09_5115 [Trichinella sp. T9]
MFGSDYCKLATISNKRYLPRRIWALGREQLLPTLPGLNSILSDTSWSGFHLCKPFNTDMLTTA